MTLDKKTIIGIILILLISGWAAVIIEYRFVVFLIGLITGMVVLSLWEEK